MKLKQTILSVFLSLGLALPAAAADDPLMREVSSNRSHYISPVDEPPMTLKGEEDYVCMAVALYHEARGEGAKGQLAVASVILRRVAVSGRFGDTVCEVVTEKAAFSFMTSRFKFPPIEDEDAWLEALDNAAFAIQMAEPSIGLEGADHYHTVDSRPYWRKDMKLMKTVGRHHFYSDPISLDRTPIAEDY